MAKNLPKLFLSPSFNPTSGSILVASIWVLAFFIILAAGLYKIVSAQVSLTNRFRQVAIGQHLARSACVYMVAKRKEEKEDKTKVVLYDTLYGLRRKETIILGNGEAGYSLIDEESKININIASGEIIKALLKITANVSEPLVQELAEEIVEYRKEHVFLVKEELLNVQGITEEMFDACKDYISVYTNGEININTASPGVLMALGLEEDLVEIIKDFRLGADGKEDTEDDGYFENTGEIINKLRLFKMLSGKQETELISLITNNPINVKSSNFSLAIETKFLGKPGMNYTVALDSKNKIREWSEY